MAVVLEGFRAVGFGIECLWSLFWSLEHSLMQMFALWPSTMQVCQYPPPNAVLNVAKVWATYSLLVLTEESSPK